MLVRALISALLNDRVVDRLLQLLDSVISRRNAEQTEHLRTEVQRLNAAILVRLENVEHGLDRLGIEVRQDRERISRLETKLIAELPDVPSPPGDN